MNLSDKIWWTRVTRIQTEKRLLSYEFHSELILIWYAFSSVTASILSINNNNLSHTSHWIAFSVLTLACSLYTKAQSFNARAQKVKECYEHLQTLYYEVKKLEKKPMQISNEIIDKYRRLLDICENHTYSDYCCALVYQYRSLPKIRRNYSFLNPLPQCIHYYKYYTSKLINITTILILYILPIAIFLIPYLH